MPPNNQPTSMMQFVQAAQKAGLSPQAIQQALENHMKQMQQAQQPAPAQGDGIAGWLPTAGAIVGGIGGSLIAPGAGTIAGSAAGQGVGKVIENAVTGKPQDTGDILSNVGQGAASGVLGEMFGPIIEGAGKLVGGKVLADAPAKTFQSALGLGSSEAADLKLPQTINEVLQHPIPTSSIQAGKDYIGQITGQNGIITNLTRDAVAGANPVDPGGILEAAQKYINDENLVNPAQRDSFMKSVTDGISNIGGTVADNPTLADPQKAFQLVKDWQTKAANLRRAPGDQAPGLANAYQGVANELSDRLYQGAGADKVLTQNVVTPQVLDQIRQISPRLADQVANAKTVGELRSTAAPFVQFGKALDLATTKSATGGMAGGTSKLLTGALGFAGGGPIGAATGFLLSPLADSAAESVKYPILTAFAKGQSLVGKAMEGVAGSAFNNVAGKAVRPVIGKVAGAVTGAGGTTPALADGSTSADSTANASAYAVPPVDGETPDTSAVRQKFMTAMMIDSATTGGRNLNVLQEMYKMANPMSQVPAELITQMSSANAAQGLVSELQQSLNQVGLQQNGVAAKITGSLRNLAASAGLDPSLRLYLAQRDGIAARLARALGNTGNLNEQEQTRALALLPTAEDSQEVANAKLQSLQSMIDSTTQSLKQQIQGTIGNDILTGNSNQSLGGMVMSPTYASTYGGGQQPQMPGQGAGTPGY